MIREYDDGEPLGTEPWTWRGVAIGILVGLFILLLSFDGPVPH